MREWYWETEEVWRRKEEGDKMVFGCLEVCVMVVVVEGRGEVDWREVWAV